MCLRPLAIGLVFLIAMGRRKFKIGRAHKNYEKKRQLAGKNSVGRPPKRRRQVYYVLFRVKATIELFVF